MTQKYRLISSAEGMSLGIRKDFSMSLPSRQPPGTNCHFTRVYVDVRAKLVQNKGSIIYTKRSTLLSEKSIKCHGPGTRQMSFRLSMTCIDTIS